MRVRLVITLALALFFLQTCQSHRMRPNEFDRVTYTIVATTVVVFLLAVLYRDWLVWKEILDPQCLRRGNLDPQMRNICKEKNAQVMRRIGGMIERAGKYHRENLRKKANKRKNEKLKWQPDKRFGKRGMPSTSVAWPHEDVFLEDQGRAKLQIMEDAAMDIGPMNSELEGCIHEKVDDATLTAIGDMIEKTDGKAFEGLEPETTDFDTFKTTLLDRGPQLERYMQLFLQSGLGRCLHSLQ
ncbi:hypothetical protein FA10DRAFT_259456 [Acaromyces ingoldii]|uniref:Uncharacterized protein n=1 Tax=Acaromyces ingoldii TaxID=215250 RepID=A0A316YT62_9BASI|nr:hypothetical protein FA10DRAFT_259456 [Acaromyces ingoldii]PWN92226.1 hypothetical protein FA10DRAFT_259456 [Acaromyces ingoldii]